ncbi:MAG: hypothetical protein IKM64_05300, partial [Clostridia bacterium]|nr:hypothetical protein [Clostridia bacterium]
DAPLVVDSPCPRLRKEESFPASPWWMVRSDRLSHPCGFVYAQGRFTGMAAAPYFVQDNGRRIPWQPGIKGEFEQYAGFGCAYVPGELVYTLGYENAPWMFIESHHHEERAELGENVFTLQPKEEVQLDIYVFSYEAQDERGLHDGLKWVYDRFHEQPLEKCSVRETVAMMAGAIARDAWLQDRHTYSGFVFDREEGYEYRALPSISWTNGLSAGVPMLNSGWRLGNDEMRTQAVDAINHIVEHSMNVRSGLPFMAEQDGVWSNHGWWSDRLNVLGHAAYLVGQAVYLILKGYALEKKRGTEHPEWLEFAMQVISKTEKSRNGDGEYPYIFSEKTGSGIEYDSFSGCWCMAAAAYYTCLTGDKQWLSGLLASEKWYHDAYVRHQECYGGPLDICKNVDSEGILAYIRAVRYLHEVTEDEVLLDHLKDALHYEYTFKFCYNSPIKVPPLSDVKWSSCGGSITSVTNPHIHPMSSSVMDEMHYYLKNREDGYIRSRLNDTVLWSCQCHNTFDGEFGYGKTGWMSERFCHCDGLLKERYPDGSPASTWFALMPWACGSIL